MSTNTSDKTLIVIPARMESKRLPGKPLLEAGGKTLLEWTYEQANQTKADRIIVATPDDCIVRFCNKLGLDCVLTSRDCPNGTTRCAEAFGKMGGFKSSYTRVINWQVDEPLIDPKYVNQIIDEIYETQITGWTLTSPLRLAYPRNENVVKTIVGCRNTCHWFTRRILPEARAHSGIYGFHADALISLRELSITSHSEAERLEQLTWIENGFVIRSIPMDKYPLSINTPEDWEQFKQLKEKNYETEN